MDLINKISFDLKEAQKGKKEIILGVLRLLIAAIKNKEIEKRTKLSKNSGEVSEEAFRITEDEIVAVIFSEVKKRKESIEQYQGAGREDLAIKENGELDVLMNYLPVQLSEEEIRKIVKESITENGVVEIKDIGRVMATLMPKVKGRAEGGLVNRIVREELGK